MTFTITADTRWSDLAENLPADPAAAMRELSRRQRAYNDYTRAARRAR